MILNSSTYFLCGHIFENTCCVYSQSQQQSNNGSWHVRQQQCSNDICTQLLCNRNRCITRGFRRNNQQVLQQEIANGIQQQQCMNGVCTQIICTNGSCTTKRYRKNQQQMIQQQQMANGIQQQQVIMQQKIAQQVQKSQ